MDELFAAARRLKAEYGRRVTIDLVGFFEEEYAATVDVVAVCNPRLLGQLRDYIEGWQPPKEDWE